MIAAFLDLPWYVQAFVAAYVLIAVAIVGLLVWARWFPLGELDPNQYGADDAHPVLKEFPHE